MNVYFSLFDSVTGDYLLSGQCRDSDLRLQAREGQFVIETEAPPVSVASVNLDPIIKSLCDKVDNEAGVFRAKFITVGAGQEMTYVFKTAEAMSWTENTPVSETPFLAAEALATGKTIKQTRDLVVQTASQFIFLGSRIEGTRMGAKQIIKEATNAKDMLAAATIDWEALTVP